MTTYTPRRIAGLRPGQIFVFGSNRAGRHGKGAALQAREQFGAKPGLGEGHSGQSYALPTKDHRIRTLPLEEIGKHIDTFLAHAKAHPELEFLVTQIGCGLAGYRPEEIGALFRARTPLPSNVYLPSTFNVPRPASLVRNEA